MTGTYRLRHDGAARLAVANGLEQGRLALHGWMYVLEEGRVEVLDVETGRFEPAPEAEGVP